MASLAPGQEPFSPFANTSEVDSSQSASSNSQKKNGKSYNQIRRPRTRSAVLRMSQQTENTPNTPRKRSIGPEIPNSRPDSPVIDLTLDDSISGDQSGDESPLKHVGRSKKRARNGEPNRNRPESMESFIRASSEDVDSSEVIEAEDNASSKVPDVSEVEKTVKSSQKSNPFEASSGKALLRSNKIRLVPEFGSQTPLRRPQLDLNSSPIKKPGHRAGLSTEKSPENAQLSSSPTKKQKCVAFSDSVVQETPSSPLNHSQTLTPKRSILKPSAGPPESSPIDPNDSSMWVKTGVSPLADSPRKTHNHAPGNPHFWQPGTIIQLEPKSNDLPQLVDGCVDVLKDEHFARKFEVYATLNLVCRTNDVSTVIDLFIGEHSPWLKGVEKHTGYKPRATPNYIKNLCKYAKRDMEMISSKLYVKDESMQGQTRPTLSPSKSDPFEARALTQALKLMACFLAAPSLNNQIPAQDVKWLYGHACDVIVLPTLSKSLVSPYLSILKDCLFPAKKRKLLFESYPNALSERILFAILNMKHYLSSSLINEKFVALRNMIQNFPAISAKHFHHWFPGLIVNLCDLSFVLYSKVVATGITTLLEAARNFLDNSDICLYTRKFVESPLAQNHRSWISDSFPSSTGSPDQVALDYILESLKGLLDGGFYKYAMDIWVGVTLLLGKYDNGIDNWKHLGAWLSVHKICFNDSSVFAKETALRSWKVIVYKICCHDLKDLRLFSQNAIESPAKAPGRLDDVLRHKIRLLIHPFMGVSNAELRPELIEGFHNCFLAILYNLLGHQPKINAKYLQIVWDKIVQPVLLTFYFKKDHSTSQMHQLGLAIITRILRPTPPSTDKSYSGIRCLSQEPIEFSEIGSLNPRWVYLRFDKVLPILALTLKSKHLLFEAKADAFLCFLESVKHVTKREVQASNTTLDLIDNLPICLEALLGESEVSYNHLNRVILTLNDTFGGSNLVFMTTNAKSVVEPIMYHGLRSLNSEQIQSIIGSWYSAIGEKKNLKFLSILDTASRGLENQEVIDFIGECLNGRKNAKFSVQELVMIGRIFQVISHDFSAIAKKVIQQIVLFKIEEFENMITQLGIVRWHVEIFNFFVVLMHDAPYGHLKQAAVDLIRERSNNKLEFKVIAEKLLVSRFHFEITHMQKDIVATVKQFENDAFMVGAWCEYVRFYDSDLASLDSLLVSAFESGLEVESLVQERLDDLPTLRSALDKKRLLDASAERVDGTENVAEEDSNDGSDTESPEIVQDSLEEIAAKESSNSEDASVVQNDETQNFSGSFDIQDNSEITMISSPDRIENTPGETNEQSENLVLAEESQDSTSDLQVPDKIGEPSIVNTKAPNTRGKRKSLDIRSGNKTKRRRENSNQEEVSQADEIIKQVSNSEDSIEADSHSENPNKSMRITSSSEENQKKVVENASGEMEVKAHSTANNTRDGSTENTRAEITKLQQKGVTALAPVEEISANGHMAMSNQVRPIELHKILSNLDDSDLATFAEKERFDLETSMIQFILRMRSVKASSKGAERNDK